MNYFYASQLRQYRLQFIRAFSNFYVNVGTGASPTLQRVPCRYGDPSRIAQSVVQGNSQNTLLTTPFISCIVNGISMSSDRRQDPTLVEKVQVNERLYDSENQAYTSDIGNRYTVERYMPIPYTLTMQVDIWTSNTDQKEQLIEQIFMLYNPSIDFQTSTNPLDWTFLSYIEMQDSITWTSRSIPVGTDNPIDVLTLMFKVPIWINPPAKVKRQNIIDEIVANIIEGTKDENDWEWNEYEFLSRSITTFGDFSVSLDYTGNSTYDIRLLSRSGDQRDLDSLPTVTSTTVNPTLVPGTTFLYNNININVTTSNLSTFVDNMHTLLANTSYSIQLYNSNSLRFVNNSGGDNIFVDGLGTPLAGLGLESTTYPGGNLAWWRLFEPYGKFNDYSVYGTNASQLRIIKSSDIEDNSKDLVGWLSQHPIDQNRVVWKIDTQSLPSMTLSPINAIIDPQAKGPNQGLPASALGQRYLLLNKPSESSSIWGNVSAEINDVIEFTGSGWIVVFSANNSINTTQFVTNLFSGKIYTWANGEWSLYVEQMYTPGTWRVSL